MNSVDLLQKMADKYYHSGWNVIPLFNYSKNPATATNLFPTYRNYDGREVKGWEPFKTRRITPDEHELFFHKNKPTGLGVVTGMVSGITVIDVDKYKGGVVQWKKESANVSKTASGGLHFFYKYNPIVRTTGLVKDVFIEIKNDGGVIILPPTQIKKDGNILSYQWVRCNKNTDETIYISDEINLDDISHIKKTKEGENVKTELSDLLRVPHGQKHTALLTLCNKMYARFPQSDWDIADQFIFSASQKYQPPADKRHVLQTMRDCKRFMLENKDKVILDFDKKENEQKKIQEEKSHVKIYRGEEADKAYDNLTSELSDGITTGFDSIDSVFRYVGKHVYVLSAQTHIGKTLFTVNSAVKVASLGYKVLYLSLEMGLLVVKTVRSVTGKPVPDTMQIAESDYFISAQTVESLMADHEADIVFLDHTHFIKKEGRDHKEVIDNLMFNIQFIAKRKKIPFVVVAHLRKINDSRPPILDDLKDSSFLSQVPSVICMLHRDRNSEEDVMNGKDELKKDGVLFVRKNRISHILRAIHFVISDSGEFIFESDPRYIMIKSQNDIDSF